MAGTSSIGSSVNAGDEVTVPATVTAISGTGRNATVTALTNAGDTITFKGHDCYGPQTDGPAISQSGKGFSVGDRVSVMCFVASVAGTGKTAVLTTTTKSSATSVAVAASTVHTPKKS